MPMQGRPKEQPAVPLRVSTGPSPLRLHAGRAPKRRWCVNASLHRGPDAARCGLETSILRSSRCCGSRVAFRCWRCRRRPRHVHRPPSGDRNTACRRCPCLRCLVCRSLRAFPVRGGGVRTTGPLTARDGRAGASAAGCHERWPAAGASTLFTCDLTARAASGSRGCWGRTGTGPARAAPSSASAPASGPGWPACCPGRTDRSD